MFKVLLISVSVILLSGLAQAKSPGLVYIEKNRKVTMYVENKRGIPSFVQGELRDKVAKGYEIEASIEYFKENRLAYRMTDPSRELQAKSVDVDKLGMRHVRFVQHYKGLPVIGGDIRAHYTNSGILKTVNGSYIPIKDLTTQPEITADNAVKRGQDDLLIDFGQGIPGPAELVVFPWQKEIYLCWRFFLFSNVPMGRWEYLVEARTGDIIFKANRIMNAEEVGSGTGVMGNTYNHLDTYHNGSAFEMSDYTRRANNDIHGHGGQMSSNAYIRTYIASNSLPGTVATDSDNIWGGTTYAPAVDGHMYTALFYDWLLREFGRNSYNNNGASMRTSVNYTAEGDNNAYWNGSQIVIWSWGAGWRSLAGCPDVIAHEWGHAITETTSGLQYQLESGALNESFSDMIGAAFEFAHDSLDTPDWEMGENGRISGGGFRDMENPHSKGDPDTYGTGDPYWIDVDGCTPTYSNDWCGVHTNSGVGNKWYSLLSDGGVHNSVTVNGLGYDTAMMIAFRANTVYWTATTNYHEAAIGTISAAHDLDPSGTWEWEVSQAWNAVGVSTPNPSLVFDFPNGIPNTTRPGADTTFQVVVSGTLGGVPVENSGQIYISVNGQAYQSLSMTQTTPNNYLATLPARSCGDVIEFYLSADLTDPAQTVFDGSELNPYRATPATGIVTVFQDDFESDMGWTVSGGSWARGVPTGGGGAYGGPDPTAGTVGANVMGYNLSGDYTNNMPEYHVTSPAIDCSTIGATRLKFWRWLGVEQPAYDHAYIRVSTDGLSWTTVWENDIEVADASWTEIDVDISSVADGQSTVYIRFTMGTTDGGWTYCGWNLDDVRVTGSECIAGPTLSITTSSLPDWTAGLLYSQQLDVTGGTGTVVWTDKNSELSGTGLTLSSSGLLSGTVLTGQTISFTAQVTDDASGLDEQLLSFTMNPALQVTTLSLPDWTEGLVYSQQVTASGGTGDLTYDDKNGDLSGTGLTLSPAGLLSGTPIASAVSFTAEVTDGLGATGEQILSFTINPSIQITTLSLPDWTEGLTYSQQLASTGGTGGIVYSDKNGDLIGTGLSLSTGGVLSGNPNAGPFSFTALVTDVLGATGEKEFSFTVNNTPSVQTTSIPDWTEGVAYSQQLSATGGTGILLYSDKNDNLSSTGLTLSATGLLSGTPIVGAVSFTAMVTDDLGVTGEQNLSCTIHEGITIDPITLPDWTAGEMYSQQITASGGTGSLLFSDKNSDLSGSGLSISSGGLLSGAPNEGSYTFTCLVVDSIGASSEEPMSVVINPVLSFITLSLPDGNIGQPYSQQVAVTGGTGTLVYTDKLDELNGTGLTLSASGLLNGTVNTPQTISFTAAVTDNVGAYVESPFTFAIIQAIAIDPVTLPDWTEGIPYSEQLTASGGTGSLTFSDKNDDLVSSGLTLSATGLLSGNPLAGTHDFICLVTDSLGGTAEEPMSVLINASLIILTTSVPEWTESVPYYLQLLRSGGTGIITFIDQNNDLSESGISLSSTGQLHGTPSLPNTYDFIVQAADAVGSVDNQALSLVINPAVSIVTTSIPDGNLGENYSEQINATGGTGLNTWSDKNSDLTGTGLTLQTDGLLTGIPLSEESITFTAQVIDAVGSVDEQQFTFSIVVPYICGDVDMSGGVDISDLVYAVQYMFGDPPGPEPIPLESFDTDGSGELDIADLVYLVEFMFNSGPDPVCGTIL